LNPLCPILVQRRQAPAATPLWNELFPAEQTRIVAQLVERVEIAAEGLNVQLRIDGPSGKLTVGETEPAA